MLDFLRLLSPRHSDALRPAAPLRRVAGVREAGEGPVVPARPDTAHSDAPSNAAPPHGPTAEVGRSKVMPPFDAAALHSEVDTTSAPRATTTGERPLRRSSVESGVVRPQHMRMPQSLPLPEAFRPADHEVVDTPLAMPAPVPRLAPAIPTSPLSMSVMAQLPSERPASPPAIHISIDRIEVRAPRTAPKPIAAMSRAQPSLQPLGDYLRGKARIP